MCGLSWWIPPQTQVVLISVSAVYGLHTQLVPASTYALCMHFIELEVLEMYWRYYMTQRSDLCIAGPYLGKIV